MTNIPNITEGPEIFTFDGNERLVADFEALIARKNAELNIPRNSPLEKASYAVIELLQGYRREIPHDFRKDYRNEWRLAIALGDLLRKLLNASNLPAFPQLWPHVLLLLENTNITQNLWSPREDADANKVFELYVALLLLPVCQTIELDDPETSSGGENPDVMANISGARWAFACKVMHTDSPKTFLERVEEGIEQIENSECDKGLVVISLKNLIRHNELWKVKQEDNGEFTYYAWPSLKYPIDSMLRLCKRYEESTVDESTLRDALAKRFQGKRAVPSVILHLCSTGSLSTRGMIIPCMPRMLYGIVLGQLTGQDHVVLQALNDSLHDRFVSFSTPTA
jgi:hypothetical protein